MIFHRIPEYAVLEGTLRIIEPNSCPCAGRPTKSKWESQEGGKHPEKLWNPTQPIPGFGTKVLQLVGKLNDLDFNRFRQISDNFSPGHVEKLKMRGILFHGNAWIRQGP